MVASFKSRIRISVFLILSLILMGSSSASLAQNPLAAPMGSRITRAAPADAAAHSKLKQSDRYQAVTIDFGVCVVKRHRAAAQKALSLSPFEKEWKNSVDSLAASECLTGGIARIPDGVMRGTLFIAFYRVDFGKLAPSISSDVIDYWKDLGEPRDVPDLQEYVATRQFAECVARVAGSDVRNLVLAMPGSQEEKLALAALSPTFGPCLVQGAKMTFSKNMLVGVLAEAVYRISSGNTYR